MVVNSAAKIQGEKYEFPSSGLQYVHPSLDDNENTFHTGSTVRFTVVRILASGVELFGVGVTLLSELLVHGDCFLRNTIWDAILVENNIVGASLVVDPTIRRIE